MPANRTAVLPRIDVRGEGGYVIVPPSRRSDGREYVWLGAGLDEPLAPAPPELLDLILRRGRWTRDSQATQRDENPPRRSAEGRRQYGTVALDRQLKELRDAPSGTRNNALFVSARKLGQLVASGVLDLQDVRAGLEQAIRPWPNLRKSLDTLDRGLERGLSEPREIPDLTRSSSRAIPPPRSMSKHAPLDEKLAQLDATDRGNATRFVERNRQRFRHCDKTGWLWWNDGHWSHEGADAAVLRAVHETVDAIKTESAIIKRGHPDGTTSQEATDLG